MSVVECDVEVIEPADRVARVRCVDGAMNVASLPRSEEDTDLVFQLAKWPLGYDWTSDERLADRLRNVRCAMFRDIGMAHIDSVFRLRALQLAAGEGPFEATSVIFVAPTSPEEPLAPGLARRISHSWPFNSVMFVGDGNVAAELESEGLPVISTAQAVGFGPDDFATHPALKRTGAASSQEIGVHIQPAWGRCGSSTAFANEIDCLVDRGLFTIRIYLDDYRRQGETSARDFKQIFAGNGIDTSPNLETAAFLAGGPVTGAINAYDAFEQLTRKRMQAVMPDRLLSALAAKARYVITNHAHSVGFAMRLCPDARIVLDTHDYLTRNALDCAREANDSKPFPDCATLRNHVGLERLLWQVADVCTTVSRDEEKRIGRHSSRCLMVLPQSYAKRWVDPAADAVWDLLLVADAHFFNINSVEWFLTSVVEPSARMQRLRIAIVGSVKGRLEAAWTERLPNVHWLGYVRDLDETRNQSRVAVCPDRGGTGISIKALTAIETGQPMVATSLALRGLPQAVRDAIPVFDDPGAMSRDILRLLDEPAAARERSARALGVLEVLRRDASFDVALDLAGRRSTQTEAARNCLAERFACAAPLPHLEFKNGKIRLDFRKGGAAEPFLGAGWHDAESWGRWMDGSRASLHLPTAWFGQPALIEIGMMNSGHPIRLGLSCDQRVLKPYGRPTDSHAAFWIDDSVTNSRSDTVRLDVIAWPSHCPADEGKSDQRVLGAPLLYLTVNREFELDRPCRIEFGNKGQAEPFLLSGWHFPEDWGRWTAGNRASLRLPARLFQHARHLKIRFLGSVRPVDVEVRWSGRRLAGFALKKDIALAICPDPRMFDDAELDVVLEIVASTSYCPRNEGDGDDERSLGVRVASVEIIPRWRTRWARWWRQLLRRRFA